MEPLTIFTFFAAIGLIGWGYLVGIKRRLTLIPRYMPGMVQDERRYAMWVGYNLLGMGTLGGIDGILQTLFPDTHVTMFLAWAVVIIPAISIRTVLGKKRYEAR